MMLFKYLISQLGKHDKYSPTCMNFIIHHANTNTLFLFLVTSYLLPNNNKMFDKMQAQIINRNLSNNKSFNMNVNMNNGVLGGGKTYFSVVNF